MFETAGGQQLAALVATLFACFGLIFLLAPDTGNHVHVTLGLPYQAYIPKHPFRASILAHERAERELLAQYPSPLATDDLGELSEAEAKRRRRAGFPRGEPLATFERIDADYAAEQSMPKTAFQVERELLAIRGRLFSAFQAPPSDAEVRAFLQDYLFAFHRPEATALVTKGTDMANEFAVRAELVRQALGLLVQDATLRTSFVHGEVEQAYEMALERLKTKVRQRERLNKDSGRSLELPRFPREPPPEVGRPRADVYR